MISAVAIPSHHGKVLAATLSQTEFSAKDLLFEPGEDMLEFFRVDIREAVISSGEGLNTTTKFSRSYCTIEGWNFTWCCKSC